MADDTINDAIEQNATGPRRASGDSGSIEQHSLPDQIAVEKFKQSRAAMRAAGLGFKCVKLSPGGTE